MIAFSDDVIAVCEVVPAFQGGGGIKSGALFIPACIHRADRTTNPLP